MVRLTQFMPNMQGVELAGDSSDFVDVLSKYARHHDLRMAKGDLRAAQASRRLRGSQPSMATAANLNGRTRGRLRIIAEADILANRANPKKDGVHESIKPKYKSGDCVAYLGSRAHRMVSRIFGSNTAIDFQHGELVVL
ncbi:hypothetical protein MMC08_002748 [Hypocenomyce scalaris]|nr:hypothetical protein [Hypocenomyce scalaris]